MTLKVIGAGFGRTGTLSLKLALEQLGFGPCYHMMEVLQHPEHAAIWLAAAKNKSDEWRLALNGYSSMVDWPAIYFYREIAAAYPDAKIVLTVRESKAWFKSAEKTIFESMMRRNADDTTDPQIRPMNEMARYLVVERTFPDGIDEKNAIKVYERHNETVKREFPPSRLLVYEPREGWEPLCRFLGVSVPAPPYPNTNSTEEFRARRGFDAPAGGG